MVNEGKARLFKNTQGRYLIYIPISLAQDSMFPFKVADSTYVHIQFEEGKDKLIITEWTEPQEKSITEGPKLLK